MLKIYHSKKAAIRAAERLYGAEWPQRLRYLEIALPQADFIYCLQSREGAPSSRPSARAERISASERSRPAGAITGRCWDIFDLMRGQPRAALIAEAKRQGINAGTAAAQYGRWKARQDR